MSGFILWLEQHFSYQTVVFLVSMFPLVELRGSIPLGISLGLPYVKTFWLAFFGSLIPVPFILLLIRPLFRWMRKFPRFKKIVEKIEARAEKKEVNIQKWGVIGLILFVGVPIPGSGVWMGSLIASMLQMRIKYALPAIMLGNLIAGVLMSVLSYGVTLLF